MADLSSSSFIPKRGPTTKRKRAGSSRRIYLFTLISYILMFATLLATGAVYLYGAYIEKQRDGEIAALNTEISSFSEEDMQKVMDFDRRLTQAAGRVNSNVSLVSIFDMLGEVTVGTAYIKNLSLTREGDEKFSLKASIETDTFDSTIFQRGIYERNQKIDSVVISDSERQINEGDTETVNETVIFTAELEVPLSAVPFDASESVVPQPIIITEPAETEIHSVEGEFFLEPEDNSEDNSNEENI